MSELDRLGNDAPLFMLAYLCVMLGVGVLGRRHQRETSLRDFYLGGSAFGFIVLFLTFFATQYSGNTLLGFAGRSYQRGASYVVSITFMILVMTVISIYAPRLYRMSRKFGYITPADFAFHRFGSHGLRVLVVVLLCWGLANYVLEQLVAMGRGVEALSGGKITSGVIAAARGVGLDSLVANVAPGEFEFMGGVLLLTTVMLTYESLGGMRAVAWTDVIQGILLFGGCACILYILTSDGDGLKSAYRHILAEEPAKVAVPDSRGIRVWISSLVLLGFGVSVYPHAIQRIFAARSLSALRSSVGLMAFMPLITTLLAFLIGYIGLSRVPGLSASESDKITIYVLGTLGEGTFIHWLVIIVLTAVVAAIMSTADSALLTLGSMFTKDIYKAYLRPDETPAHYLRVGKWFSWGLMVFLIVAAYASLKTQSSIWLLIKLKLEFMVQISPVFLLGPFLKKLDGPTVLRGMIAGTSITLVIWGGVMFGAWDDRSPLGISAGVWGLAVNYSICLTGAFTSSRPQPA